MKIMKLNVFNILLYTVLVSNYNRIGSFVFSVKSAVYVELFMYVSESMSWVYEISENI